MIEYVLWVIFALLGFGTAWLIWGRASTGTLAARGVAERLSTAHAGIDGSWTGPAPFRVVTLDGAVRYEGISGAAARRCIEGLRREGVEWRSYRSGIPWDNGPRET